MANKERGEVAVSIGGKDYILRPSFSALVEIERRTGQTILEIATNLSAARIGVADLVAVLFSAIKAGQTDWPEYDVLGEMVVKAGVAELIGPVGGFIVSALNGGQETNAGNGRAAKGKKSTPSAA